MRDDDILAATLLAEACFTLEEISRACAVTEQWVTERVTEGMLGQPMGPPPQWRFGRADLRRVRRMSAIERDFDAAPELAALVADLLEEMDSLRARLRRAGLE